MERQGSELQVKGGQGSHSLGQAWRSKNRLSWAGILRWDGGMSHMLSMSCLCVYQNGGWVKMLWVIAIWAGLQIHCPLPPPLSDGPPRWAPSGWEEESSSKANTSLAPSHSPISSDTHSSAINKLEVGLGDQPGHYKAPADTETTASSRTTQRWT